MSDCAGPLAAAFLPEFDQEFALTRTCLARVPEEHFGWKPHAKSWPLAELATHLAVIPGWAAYTFASEELDLAPPGGEPLRFPPATTHAALMAAFDSNVAAAREAIATANDADYAVPWTLLHGGQKVFTLPRTAVIRTFVLSHNIHHRAQLGLCLRLLDIPVPAIYGPSADEGGG